MMPKFSILFVSSKWNAFWFLNQGKATGNLCEFQGNLGLNFDLWREKDIWLVRQSHEPEASNVMVSSGSCWSLASWLLHSIEAGTYSTMPDLISCLDWGEHGDQDVLLDVKLAHQIYGEGMCALHEGLLLHAAVGRPMNSVPSWYSFSSFAMLLLAPADELVLGQAKYHCYWIHLYPQIDYASRGTNLLSNCQGDAQVLV